MGSEAINRGNTGEKSLAPATFSRAQARAEYDTGEKSLAPATFSRAQARAEYDTGEKSLAPATFSRAQARAEYESATRGLIFTKDFQTRQEALMHDPLATVGERVMAWILRRSWGEYVLYAIRDDGEPAFQRDCAKDLGIDKKAVSHAVAYYQRRGYLENQPKKLYPVISPVLGGPPKKVVRSSDFLQFINDWKVAHSSDFHELEVARSTVERIRKVILSEYKKSRTAGTNGGPSLYET